MTEEQIRVLFAHIEAVRARWGDEFGYIPADYVALSPFDREVRFCEIGGDYYDGYHPEVASIPLLAFTDYEAAAAPVRVQREHDRLRAAWREEEEERAQYERLKAKFGG